MSADDLRAEARIPVTHLGKLSAGDTWFPCMVLDMSNSGFLMVCNKQLEVGLILDFRCELYPEKFLECKIEIMHSKEDAAGVMITEIDEKTTALLQAYLEEKFAVNLDKRKARGGKPEGGMKG